MNLKCLTALVMYVSSGSIPASSSARVEQPPRGPDERLALPVLLIAGLLADEHDPGVRGARAEHGLVGLPVQRTAPASGGRLPERVQAGAAGHEGLGRVRVLGRRYRGSMPPRVPAVPAAVRRSPYRRGTAHGGGQTRIGCGDSRRAGSGPSYSRMIS